jgi:hypothetical protein
VLTKHTGSSRPRAGAMAIMRKKPRPPQPGKRRRGMFLAYIFGKP